MSDSPALQERRFSAINRLAGDGSLNKLTAATVVIVGIGGVGSWAAEALARTGVGHLVLIDMDHVAVSNVNRQVHATDHTFGMAKITAMRERIAAFAPLCRVTCIDDFASPANLPDLFPRIEDASGQQRLLADAVLDCCDHRITKIALTVFCRTYNTPFIMAGSAGGKLQASRLQLTDLAFTSQDPLLAKIRYELRYKHRFEMKPTRKMKVACVFSDEPVKRSENCDATAGLSCAGYGSVVTTTASMGMLMAGWAIEQILTRSDSPMGDPVT
ncbi:MAG: tRNA threonylcarbamoyladenosine dehydratase [Burkholderiales bacterium]|nr:tRNA threonylcarbamoyladenosine dehydratase [Burkholderiales bacterium]